MTNICAHIFVYGDIYVFINKKMYINPCLEPQTTIYKWLFQWDDFKSFYRKWLFHQTSIYKWLFRVPGVYIYLYTYIYPPAQKNPSKNPVLRAWPLGLAAHGQIASTFDHLSPIAELSGGKVSNGPLVTLPSTDALAPVSVLLPAAVDSTFVDQV